MRSATLKASPVGLGDPPVDGNSRLDFQNPWPGLEAYNEASSLFFHGRGEESLELLRLIRMAPLTVVYSKSGLGKSSLLQAGLFPLLRHEHFLPVYLRVDFSGGALDSPLEQAKQRLIEELDRTNSEYPRPADDESLWEYLHRKDLEIWSADNFPLTPVLVFDQFEELFSRSGGNEEFIQRVFNGLADLIENRIPAELASEAAGAKRSRLDLLSQRYCLVLSFREDFLPEMRAWERKVPSLLRNYLRLTPMSRHCAIAAVEQSGKEVLEDGVAPSIVDFVGRRDLRTEPSDASEMIIEPVLLSLFCAQLNRRRAPGVRISQALVDDAGQDILDSFYREALDDAEVKGPPEVDRFIEEYLIQGDHFRGDYPKKEALDKNLLTSKQLAALTDRHRLLRIVQHADTARVELIHDRLVPVVRKARDERKIKQQQDELKRQADAQRERAEEQERAASRLSRALLRARIMTVVVLFVAGAAGYYWWKAAAQADLASSRALATSAVYQSQTDPELGVLLAIQAVEGAKHLGVDATREADDALGRTIESARVRSSYKIDGSINKIAFSPDRKRVVVGMDDGALHLLNWPDTTKETPLEIEGGKYFAPTFAPAGTRIAALNFDGTVSIWDWESGKIERTLKPRGRPYALSFSPDGKMLAVGGESTALWQLDSDDAGRVLSGHKDGYGRSFAVTALAFHPSAPLLATGATDETVRLWDLREGRQVALLQGHTGTIENLRFSADGRRLLSSSQDSTVHIWNVANGRLRATLNGHANSVFSASYSQDGQKIVTASADATVRIWDAGSAREIVRLLSHTGPVVWAEFADGDRSIVSASWDGTIKTWSASGHTGKVNDLKFSPDGRVVATAGTDGTIHLWDAVSGDQVQVLVKHKVSVTNLRFSHDGRSLVSGDSSGRIEVWDPATGQNIASLCCQIDGVSDLVLSADGSRLLSAAKSAGVALWDVKSETLEKQLIASNSVSLVKATFSPDGNWIAAADDDGKLWIWNAGNLEKPRQIQAHAGQIFRLEFAPDSTTLLTGGGDYRARLWDVASGELRQELSHDAIVVDGVFSPDGSRLFTSTLKGGIWVWDPETGERLEGPSPHAGMAGLDLSADGTRLATFSWDRTARVWDTKYWRELATLTHREQVDGGAISPDGTHLATYTPYDGVRVLPLDLGELIRLAKTRVTRNLTTEECHRYLRRDECPPVSR